MSTLPYPNAHGRPPVVIDDLFEEEARAMAKAMQTGQLPTPDKPYYQGVLDLYRLHARAQAVRALQRKLGDGGNQ